VSRAVTGAFLAALLAPVVASAAIAADRPADLCLEFVPAAFDEHAWAGVQQMVGEVVRERPALFPAPLLVAGSVSRLDVASSHDALPATAASCLEPGFDWTARYGRDFLEAGADRMLAEAPTTPGIDSDVTIEWYPDESRLRTTLVFAGPLDIPNGTCWVDDRLSVDETSGTVVASGEQGVRTSPFAEVACGRFFGNLPDGGAGAQVATLLPAVVELDDGGVLRLVAEDVVVRDDAIIISGSLQRD
jgi:hypothetical protein